MNRSLKTVLLAVFLAGVAGAGLAQQQHGRSDRMGGPGMMMHGDGGQMPMQQGAGPMMGMGQMMGMGPMMGGPGQHIEGRLAFLRTELGIKPDQEAAWNRFAEAMRASASSMRSMHDKMMSGGDRPANLPERLEWHEEMMSTRLEAIKNLRSAAGPLYDELTPEQKQTADSLMMGMM